MKTFALAMTAAAANAWGTKYELSISEVEQFTVGLLEGAIGTSVPDVMSCISDAETLVKNVETTYADFKKESFDGVKDGIEMVGTIMESLTDDLKDCKAAVTGIEDLITMAKNFSSPWSFAYHVGKDLLVNGVSIYHDVDGAVTAYEASDYHTFGLDIGAGLNEVFIGGSKNIIGAFGDACTVPTGVEFGEECRMRELCGTGCGLGKCVWTWPTGSTMDDPATACGCEQCDAASYLQ